MIIVRFPFFFLLFFFLLTINTKARGVDNRAGDCWRSNHYYCVPDITTSHKKRRYNTTAIAYAASIDWRHICCCSAKYSPANTLRITFACGVCPTIHSYRAWLSYTKHTWLIHTRGAQTHNQSSPSIDTYTMHPRSTHSFPNLPTWCDTTLEQK